jgi:hypothetical protein
MTNRAALLLIFVLRCPAAAQGVARAPAEPAVDLARPRCSACSTR